MILLKMRIQGYQNVIVWLLAWMWDQRTSFLRGTIKFWWKEWEWELLEKHYRQALDATDIKIYIYETRVTYPDNDEEANETSQAWLQHQQNFAVSWDFVFYTLYKMEHAGSVYNFV